MTRWALLNRLILGQNPMKFVQCPAGQKAYWFVWADQWLSLFCSDIGLFILAGESIKVSLKPEKKING